MDIWPAVHAERKALAADLRGLSDEDWAKPSLCGDWTVRDVLAHMTSTAKLTPPAFFGKMIGSGFSFNKVQEKGVAAQLQPAHRLQAPHFRAHAARHRRRVDPRHRTRGVGSHLVAGHGHDRTQGSRRRPDRRGCGDAAVALLRCYRTIRTVEVFL